MKPYSMDWANALDLSHVDLYPIQFANCKRIEENDAVYIFDEVGSGKTISSGLMALHYLYNNETKDVLVITINSLVKSSDGKPEHAQFLNDWYDKLPFDTLNLGNERIKITNNICTNIAKHNQETAENGLVKKEYGLVIVDEAHLFLNEDSLRCEELKQIHAEKVVFLTASPIKSEMKDLERYHAIASKMLVGKDVSKDWITDISNPNPNSLICSQFNASYPVTRYFKDTIMALQNLEKESSGVTKVSATRMLPEIWSVEGECKTKTQCLCQKIHDSLRQNPSHRFVVFTRYINETEQIKQALVNNGFSDFDSNKSSPNTVKIITGNNSYELSNFAGMDHLPTILVLTYQIAEQGVNLPGFDYVVNYHIPAFPSSLEQRIGRIDRMGKREQQSKEKQIHMCYVLYPSWWDSDFNNFFSAVWTYMRTVLTCIPSKNTLLNKEILDYVGGKIDGLESFKSDLETILESPETMQKLYNKYNDAGRVEDEKIEFLKDLCTDHKISTTEPEQLKKQILQIIRDSFPKLEEFQQRKENVENILEACSDKIFYISEEGQNSIKTISSDTCAKTIAGLPAFQKYRTEFIEQVRFPNLMKSFRECLNRYYENAFSSNSLELLFLPKQGRKKQVLEVLSEYQCEDAVRLENFKKVINEASEKTLEYAIQSLPVFKLMDQYGRFIRSELLTNGNLRSKFDWNIFFEAEHAISNYVWRNQRTLGLSHDFVKNQWPELNKVYDEKGKYEQWLNSGIWYEYEKWLKFKQSPNIKQYFERHYSWSEDDVSLQASNWYKLAYHQMRNEALLRQGWHIEKVKEWKNRGCTWAYQDVYQKIETPYCVSQEREARLLSVCAEFADQKYSCTESEGQEILKTIPDLHPEYISGFEAVMCTSLGRRRINFPDCLLLSVEQQKKIRSGCLRCSEDFWTLGILHELKKSGFCENISGEIGRIEKQVTWGEYLELPEEFRKIVVYT